MHFAMFKNTLVYNIIIYAHGGYIPYNYIWNTGDSSMQIDSLANMQYSVIVSHSQNCLALCV